MKSKIGFTPNIWFVLACSGCIFLWIDITRQAPWWEFIIDIIIIICSFWISTESLSKYKLKCKKCEDSGIIYEVDDNSAAMRACNCGALPYWM